MKTQTPYGVLVLVSVIIVVALFLLQPEIMRFFHMFSGP
jgi:hypothetical protein